MTRLARLVRRLKIGRVLGWAGVKTFPKMKELRWETRSASYVICNTSFAIVTF
jgi:hypothetical protein